MNLLKKLPSMPTINFSLYHAFLVFVLLFTVPCNAQMSKTDRKALRERGTDSAWIYHPFLARTRFYLGSTRVTGNEFENTLRNSDAEVETEISGAWKQFNTSRYLSWGAGATFLTGWLVINANQNNYYNYSSNNKVSTTGLVLLGVGLALEGVSLGFSIDANTRYRNGLRLFNKKAKEGTLQPVQLRVGTTNHGMGLMVRF
jgi:hypothetical protein